MIIHSSQNNHFQKGLPHWGKFLVCCLLFTLICFSRLHAQTSIRIIASDSSICVGSNITLSANPSGYSGELSYSWIQNGEIEISNESSVIVSPDSSVNYKLIVSDGDSIDTAYFSIKVYYPTYKDTTVTACNDFVWHEVVYSVSGDYVFSYLNAHGCESSETLHLTINQSDHQAFTEVACDSFSWYGNTYTSSGNYIHSYINELGCNSADTLHLTINQSTHQVAHISGCNSYLWNGTIYSNSGNYIFPYTNSDGCFSTDSLHLIVKSSSSKTINVTACDEYSWHGAVYSVSGVYEFDTINVVGCDSLESMQLTITSSSSILLFDTACNSYNWHGRTYTESGEYSWSGTNIAGCDSIVILELTIYQSEHLRSRDTLVCDSYEWHGQTYTNSGLYVYRYNLNGDDVNGKCISTDSLFLTVKHSSSKTIYVTACDEYSWHGTVYNISGVYEFDTINVAGCDSLVTLHLTIHSSSSVLLFDTACNSYYWHGQTYTESGEYSWHGTNIYGCDSTVILELTIYQSEHMRSSDMVVCDSYDWHGQTYTNSGLYVYRYNMNEDDMNGKCISTDTLFLTVKHSSSKIINVTACDEYSWHGTVYNISGAYEFDTLNVAGCDSLVTLNLTLKYSTSSYIDSSVCDSLLWHGQIFKESGEYIWTGVNAGGCDSVVTLYLTIHEKPSVELINGDGIEVELCSGHSTELTNNTDLNGGSLKWVSANPSIVSIDSLTGLALGVSSGRANIIFRIVSQYACTNTTSISMLIKPSPAKPVISGKQTVCIGSSIQLYTQQIGGVWDVEDSMVATVNQSGLVTGISVNYTNVTYTVTNNVNGCTNSETKTISVKMVPNAPDTVYGYKSACKYMNKDSTLYRVKPVPGAIGYWWYNADKGIRIVRGQGTDSIWVKYNDTATNSWSPYWQPFYIVAFSADSCWSQAATYWVYNITPYLGNINGNSNPCPFINKDTLIKYSVSPVDNIANNDVKSYHWSVPVGMSIVGRSDTSFINVKFSDSLSTISSLSVIGISNCGYTNARTFALRQMISSTPGSINGPKNLCPFTTNDTLTYSIETVDYATSYIWELPSKLSLISGQGTPLIKVKMKPGYTDSVIRVRALNNCSVSSEKSITILANYAVPTPTAIMSNTGNFGSGCVGDTIQYNVVANSPSATEDSAVLYRWTRPNNTSIVWANPDSSQIRLRFISGYSYGTLSVKGQSVCAVQSTLAKSVNLLTAFLSPIPAGIVSSTGNYAACFGDTILYSVTSGTPNAYQVSAKLFRWTKPNNSAIVWANADSSQIKLKFFSNFISDYLMVRAQNSCGTLSDARSVRILDPLAAPSILNIVSSTGTFGGGCLSDTITYTIVSDALASNQRDAIIYRWTKPNNTSIVWANVDSSQIKLRFNIGYTSGDLSVKGITVCGGLSAIKTVSLSSPFESPVPLGITSRTGNFSGCIGDTISYFVIPGTLTANQQVAVKYRWSIPNNCNIISANSDSSSLKLRFLNGYTSGTLSVRAQNTCGTMSATKSVALIAPYAAPTPANIVSETGNYFGACTGSSIYYSVTPGNPSSVQTPALMFKWTIPSNTTIMSANSDSSQILLRFNSGFISGILSVKGQTGCGSVGFPYSVSLLSPRTSPTPASIVSSTANYAGCTGSSITYTVSPGIPSATQEAAFIYRWTKPLNTTILTANADSSLIVLQFNPGYTSGLLSVKSQSTCAVFSATKSVSLIAPYLAATPVSIISRTGNYGGGCVGDTISYTVVPRTPNATQLNTSLYRWTIPNNTSIISGNADSSVITLRFNAGYISGSLSARGQTACLSYGLPVTVGLSTAFTSPVPASIVSSTGNWAGCIGDTIQYSVTSGVPTSVQTVASKYRWSVPNNTIILRANADSSNITLRFNAGYTSGQLSVRAQNKCGTLSAAKTVNLIAPFSVPTPLAIVSSTGNFRGCIGGSITYTVTPGNTSTTQVAASVYRWTLPNNTSVISANADSSQVVLRFNAGYIGGSLAVFGQSACGGKGLARTVVLLLPSSVSTPVGIVSRTGNYYGCIGDTISFIVSPGAANSTYSAANVYKWNLPNYTSIVASNADSSRIVLRFNSGYLSGSLSVSGKTYCGGFSSAFSVMLLAPKSVPIPTAITSRTGYYTACVGDTISYYVSAGTSSALQLPASLYRWTLPNNTSIILSNVDSSRIKLQFNSGYIGGNLSVWGQNACGGTGGKKVQALTKASCAALVSKNSITKPSQNIYRITASVLPNPSFSIFELNIGTENGLSGKYRVNLLDVQGRLVKTYYVNAAEKLFFGNELIAGTYWVEIIGSNQKIVKRILKL